MFSFVFQDLLVDCFKPTEVRHLILFPSFPHDFLLLFSHLVCFVLLGLCLGAARQDPWDAEAFHTSEEMMAPLYTSLLPPPLHLTFCLPPHNFILASIFIPLKIHYEI